MKTRVEPPSLTQRDLWLLAGEYKTLKELPSVEGDLKKEMIENLKTQRIIARSNFRGVIADKPVDMVRMLQETSFKTQHKNIYLEHPNTFNLTEDNTSFTEDEMPLLKHLSISREELITEANALYKKRLKGIKT